jgi:hypothetical protein
LKYKPNETAAAADMPMDHITIHAIRHALPCVRERLVAGMLADPEWCDPVWAGRVCYQLACYIGGEALKPLPAPRTLPDGVPHAIPVIGSPRTLSGMGTNAKSNNPFDGTRFRDWFLELSNRLSRCAITCCDWKRLAHQMAKPGAAIFFDPPYAVGDRAKVYADDSRTVAVEVREWCAGHPATRWVYAGYDTECEPLAAATGAGLVRWKANGGYANHAGKRGRANAKRECLVFSPAI